LDNEIDKKKAMPIPRMNKMPDENKMEFLKSTIGENIS